MAALLDDRGALTVVLADNDERPPAHADRGEVGKRVGGDVGADRGLPCHGAPQGVVDRSAEHRRRARFGRVGLDMDAERIHDVRYGRSLVAADVGDTRLQQGFGHGENAFSVESLPRAELEQLDLFREGAFHGYSRSRTALWGATPRPPVRRTPARARVGS